MKRGYVGAVSIALCTALLIGNTSLAAEADPAPQAQGSRDLTPICAHVFGKACGLLGAQGEWVVEPAYRSIDWLGGDLYSVETESDVLGIVNSHGEMLVRPRFAEIGQFHNGMAAAKSRENFLFGFIDRQGAWVIQPQFADAGPFVDGIARVGLRAVTSAERSQRWYYIKTDGTPAFDGRWEEADDFRYGMAVVKPPVNKSVNADEYKNTTVVIDRQGRALFSQEDVHAIRPVAPDRLLETRYGRDQLLDGSGHTLIAAPPDGALNDLGGHRLALKNEADGKNGLVDSVTAKILVAPEAGWDYIRDFSQGVAWVHVQVDGESFDRLIAADGTVVLDRVAFGASNPFIQGASQVMDDSAQYFLVDKQGQALGNKTRYNSIEALHEFSRPQRQPGAVWKAQPGVSWTTTTLLDAGARPIATIDKPDDDCAVYEIRAGDGRRIWPPDLEAYCAVDQDIWTSAEAAGHGLTEDRLRPARLAKAGSSMRAAMNIKSLQDTLRERLGKSPTGADAATRRAILDAPWEVGPTTVDLAVPASVEIPDGYRYLAPEYVPALKRFVFGHDSLTDDIDDPDVKEALIVSNDLRIKISVLTVSKGHMPLPEQPVFDADKLLDSLESTLRYGNGIGSITSGTSHLVSWLSAPRWSEADQRLEWAYEDSVTNIDSYDFNTTQVVDALKLGRDSAVSFEYRSGGILGGDIAILAREHIRRLADSLAFDAGHAYADYRAGERVAPFSPAALITGDRYESVDSGVPAPDDQAAGKTIRKAALSPEEQKKSLIVLFCVAVFLAGWLAWALKK